MVRKALLLVLALLAAPASAQFTYNFPTTATALAAKTWCIDAGASDAYACNLPDTPGSAYPTGFEACFVANTANTGNATIAFNSLTAKNITKVQGAINTTLADNDIRVGQIVCGRYDGTQFQMISQLGNAAAGGGGITDSSTTYTGGTTNGIVYTNGSVVKTDGCTTVGTISGTSTTSNYINCTKTFPATLTTETSGVFFSFTGDNDVQIQNGLKVKLAQTATSGNSAIRGEISDSGGANGGSGGYFSNTGTGGAAYGVTGSVTGTGGGGSNLYGSAGFGSGAGGSTWGGFGSSRTTSNISVGIGGIGDSDVTTGIGIFGLLESAPAIYGSSPTNPTAGLRAVSVLENRSIAAPLLIASDAAAAVPSTGPTATVIIQDGAKLQEGLAVLTSSTATAENQANGTSKWSSYTISNAQVVALGAVTTGDITMAVLPAKTVVENAYLNVITPDGSANALTVACGRTSATYIDYIVASDGKTAARYGDSSGERGTNLTGYDVPNDAGTTNVVCHFIKTSTNLSTVTGFTARLTLKTALLP